VFDRVADGGRTADELWVTAVPFADPVEPTHHEGNLGAKDAAVAVDFVDNDQFKRGEKPVPEPVGIRKKCVMQHIGVREEDGGSTLANLGIDRDRPLRRVLETFKVAEDLWAGGTVTHEGTFTAKDASLNVEPAEIPVYVGAQGPQMLRMSAKHADGTLINACHPKDLEWSAGQIAQGLKERPDERGEFDALAFASVSVAEDEASAREAARPPVAFIVGGAAPPVLERHGIDREAAESVSEALEGGDLNEAFDHVTEGMIDAFCIAGTTGTVAERFSAALEHVDGIVVGSPLGPDLETAVELAGEALGRASEN